MRVPPVPNVHRHDGGDRALTTLTGEIDVDVTAVTFRDHDSRDVFRHALLHTAAAGGSLQLPDPSPALERLVALTGSGSRFLTLPDAHAGRVTPLRPFPLPRTAHRPAPALPALPGGVL